MYQIDLNSDLGESFGRYTIGNEMCIRDRTVCILEAMKLMTEIESDYDCEIEAVLASNEQKVEYGQPLFKVKKIED